MNSRPPILTLVMVPYNYDSINVHILTPYVSVITPVYLLSSF